MGKSLIKGSVWHAVAVCHKVSAVLPAGYQLQLQANEVREAVNKVRVGLYFERSCVARSEWVDLDSNLERFLTDTVFDLIQAHIAMKPTPE